MACLVGCFVVAEFLLTSASCGPSAIAEPLVDAIVLSKLLYASPAWFGFISVEHLNLIQKLLDKSYQYLWNGFSWRRQILYSGSPDGGLALGLQTVP